MPSQGYDPIRDILSMPQTITFEGVVFILDFDNRGTGLEIGYRVKEVLPTSKHYRMENQKTWYRPIFNDEYPMLYWEGRIYCSADMEKAMNEIRRMLEKFGIAIK
jgi:hypothetical protein